MCKKILITSTDLMMIQFLVPHVINLTEHGWHVDIACSNVGNRVQEVRKKLDGIAHIYTVRLHRNPANPGNLSGYNDMKKLIQNGDWDIIWTNEPVMGMATRFAARKTRKHGTKVVYMVHGFHFYKGAPLVNWMLFYPAERLASRYTDTIITINHDDYEQAKKLHAKQVKYIHGIGVNTERLDHVDADKNIRRELGIPDEACVLLSVGELNKNKNHKIIIDAMAELGNKNIYYLICGKGEQMDALKKHAAECGIGDHIFLLGYRTDLADICAYSDVFVFPSIREGLSLSTLEAMYCGLPLVTSNAGGLMDYVKDNINGFVCNPNDSAAFAEAIGKLKEDALMRKQMGEINRQDMIPYNLDAVKTELLEIFNNELI